LLIQNSPPPLQAKLTTRELTEARRRREREFLIDNLLVPIHFIVVMIRWIGLAPWEFKFPFQVALYLPS